MINLIFTLLSNYDNNYIYILRILSKSIYNTINESYEKIINNNYKLGINKYNIASNIILKYLDTVDDYIVRLFKNRAIILEYRSLYNANLDIETQKYIIIYITSNKEIKEKSYDNCKLKINNGKLLIIPNYWYSLDIDENFNLNEILAIENALNNIIFFNYNFK